MFRLILVLLFLVASVWFGLTIVQHPSFLFIIYQPWTIQVPLWFALIVLIVFLSLFYFVINSIDRTQFLWFRLKNWLRFRREHQSYSKTQQGLTDLIEEHWKKAERLLLSGVSQSVEPLLNYLGAAKAAHEQSAFDRRDRCIQKAYQFVPEAEIAIGLTEAHLQLSRDQLEQAVATLTRLRQLSPSHPAVLKLLEKAYVRLADWKQLQALLSPLRKAKILNAEQAEQFQKNLYCELFRLAQNKNLAEIQQIWNDIPRQIKRHPDVVYAYVKQLLRFDEKKEIEELICRTLKYHWQPDLVKLYGTLSFENLNQQLVVAGAWLKRYDSHPELLLTLGRLCARVQLWGKAKDYFEKCLAQGLYAEASLEYGKLLEQLGENEEALRIYRNGLAAN